MRQSWILAVDMSASCSPSQATEDNIQRNSKDLLNKSLFFRRQWRHTTVVGDVQDMYKQTQVADVVSITSAVVNGDGHEIVK